jgi:hypothetical protein
MLRRAGHISFLTRSLVLTLATAGLWTAGSPPSHAGVLPDVPDAIACSVRDPTGRLAWEELVFFVSARLRGGDTLYKTLTSDPVILTVTADHLISAPNLADCDGRAIDDLIDTGRAFHLAPLRAVGQSQ